MTRPTCNAIGCAVGIFPTELFCQRHAALLQSDVSKILARTHRPGQAPSKVFRATLETARNEIFQAVLDGHRAPRPGQFEWDDHDPRRI